MRDKELWDLDRAADDLLPIRTIEVVKVSPIGGQTALKTHAHQEQH
jgi:hypothetical protein